MNTQTTSRTVPEILALMVEEKRYTYYMCAALNAAKHDGTINADEHANAIKEINEFMRRLSPNSETEWVAMVNCLAENLDEIFGVDDVESEILGHDRDILWRYLRKIYANWNDREAIREQLINECHNILESLEE